MPKAPLSNRFSSELYWAYVRDRPLIIGKNTYSVVKALSGSQFILYVLPLGEPEFSDDHTQETPIFTFSVSRELFHLHTIEQGEIYINKLSHMWKEFAKEFEEDLRYQEIINNYDIS